MLWQPRKALVKRALLTGFMTKVSSESGRNLSDYDALWHYSISEPEHFWDSVWDYCGVLGEKGARIIKGGEDLHATKFFPDARLNYAENLLQVQGDDTALTFCGEDGSARRVSHDTLRESVASLRSAMRQDGVGPGDRVAGVVTNSPEAIVAMLATASLGAVWSSCSPDFGVAGIVDRLGQVRPKLLFAVEGYHYAGRWFETLSTCARVVDQIPGIGRLIACSYSGNEPDLAEFPEQVIAYDAYMARGAGSKPGFHRVPFDSPLFILFSSGTTGLPKCIVHSTGGALLQHVKEHRLNCDIHDGDRLMYFTTCGWMMWNWMVSALACRASLVLFDGMPMYPRADCLPRIVSELGVTQFGASAKYFDSCSKQGLRPKEDYDLARLRTIFSTGSPLSADAFHYIYDAWKSDVCLSSIAGGTDILGCFVGGSPISPVFAGQCQKRILGMDVRVFDAEGRAVTGEAGELVCASAHPSIPVGFLDDPDDRRFRSAYFERFPGVWHHGDWVILTEQGGMVFQGRSDATLNPGGVRIGTAEIYRPVEAFPQVAEALVVARNRGSDVEIVLFVKMADDCQLTDSLIAEIRHTIRTSASPRHVPHKVIAVTDIPRTRSGKIVELAVRNIINGREVSNIHALANPEALEQFRNLPELVSDESY